MVMVRGAVGEGWGTGKRHCEGLELEGLGQNALLRVIAWGICARALRWGSCAGRPQLPFALEVVCVDRSCHALQQATPATHVLLR